MSRYSNQTYQNLTPADSPDRSTLKGTIEHRLSVPPASSEKAKKLNSSASSNKPTDFQLSGAQRAQRDRERVLKARAQEQALNARQPFTIEQSVGIIGVKFHKLPDGPAVINTVFAGTPAAKAGMHVDDQIVAVDGVPTRNLNKDQCYDLIVGSPNTPVTLSVLRRQNFDVKQMVRMDFNDIPDPLVRRDYLNSL
jgi:C-terminal processing protease CtpA/Prc